MEIHGFALIVTICRTKPELNCTNGLPFGDSRKFTYSSEASHCYFIFASQVDVSVDSHVHVLY